MSDTSIGWLACMLLALPGSACAVERPNPSLDERVRESELVVVADNIQPQSFAGREFGRFYRVKVRVTGVLKGGANVGDRIEVVVDNTIAERRNDCCTPGQSYVLFLREHDGRYVFVGSPLGAVPIGTGRLEQ